MLETYQDAIERLVTFADGAAQERDTNRMRVAIQDAYRYVGMGRKWRYFQRHDRINLAAPYSTGTITSVGATVTLSGGSWPSWARYGTLFITGHTRLYRVSEVSGATMTLDPNTYPLANISTGTTYKLFRSQYPLPADLWTMDEINDESLHWSQHYLSPSGVMGMERNHLAAGSPWYWTVLGSSDLYAQHVLWITGYPKAVATLDFIYTRTPRPLMFDGVQLYADTSTITCTGPSAAGTTCTINNQVLQDEVVNSIIRFGRPGSTDHPKGLTSTNPYYFQNVISSVSNDGTNTTVTLDSAAPYAVTSTKFTVSDPLDLPEYLLDLFHARCKYNFTLLTDSSEGNAKTRTFRDEEHRELLRAKDRDAVAPGPRRATGWHGWDHADWDEMIAASTVTTYEIG
jgi:hypothetical protein